MGAFRPGDTCTDAITAAQMSKANEANFGEADDPTLQFTDMPRGPLTTTDRTPLRQARACDVCRARTSGKLDLAIATRAVARRRRQACARSASSSNPNGCGAEGWIPTGLTCGSVRPS